MAQANNRSRLQVLARHVAVYENENECEGVSVQETAAGSGEVRPAPSGGKGTLSIVDNRTGKHYTVEVSEGGTIKSAGLSKIKAGGDGVGLRVYDPGYTNTVSCISHISFIDGEKGILRYRGYPIEELADKASFLETAYLVLFGDLPSSKHLSHFQEAVCRHSAVPVAVEKVIEALPFGSHPMGTILTGLGALSCCHPEQNPALAGQNIYHAREQQDKQIVRLIAKMPTLAAQAYHRLSGRKPSAPNQRLNYAENFLYMLDAGSNPSYKPNPRLARALEVMFILHAEHELNCSTSAARHLASSGVDVYTVMMGAVGALYGPLHGGANEAVLRMLERIGSVENVPAFIERVKSRKEKLFGFGHRVYKNFDPRATIIRKVAQEVFEIAGYDPLIEVAIALQDAALSDQYFIQRKLYPNVDFYSGLVYRALGFPNEFFTVLFAIPRMVGWCAHWRESLTDPDNKIVRPQQDYRGVWLRHFKPLITRGEPSGQSDADTLVPLHPSNAYRRRVAGESWQ